MLKRKIISKIQEYLQNPTNRILIIDGARQIGKSYIIRHVGQEMFPHFVEINMEEDKQGDRLFANARTSEDFYMALSSFAGKQLGTQKHTLVFIDEIQAYDHLLTLLKFLVDEGRYTYIASGSQLGVALKKTQSIPGGRYERIRMYPMDLEEFLWANGIGDDVILHMQESFQQRASLNEGIHNRMLNLMRKYLLIGGLPAAVDCFVKETNIARVRRIHADIYDLYLNDVAKYEKDSGRKLKIQRIYSMVPSIMENRKKRVVAKDIEDKVGKRMENYHDEFDYLSASGIAIECKAISKPSYPLTLNMDKNLLKLYMNDVGMLTALLYRNNIKVVMEDIKSVNLGSVYETFVAQELSAHGLGCFYFDNKKHGEVDFLIDDNENLTTIPIEVKSGRDYSIHSALDHFMAVEEYNINQSFVFSNERTVSCKNGIIYMPIYYAMFLQSSIADTSFAKYDICN